MNKLETNTEIKDINNNEDDDSIKKLETINVMNSGNPINNDIITDEKTTTNIETNENTSTQSTVNIPTTNTDTEMDSTQQNEPLAQNSDTTQSSLLANEISHPHLIYNDIVMEFKEFPGERYLFPREAILEVIPSEKPSSVKASFLLPIDPESADQFFWDAKKKIKYFGEYSDIPIIKEMAKKYQTEMSDKNNKEDESKKGKQYQPVNIRISNANQEIITALNASVYNSDYVRSKLIEKLNKNTIPIRKYIDYKITEKDQEAINELIQRAHTVPDIVTGPIAAEKKEMKLV
ncbi:unnamed protein product [Cunninghamella blakesleeana]